MEPNKRATRLLADWEKHTKGIGSKLLSKWGYKPNTGLGKHRDGIVEPIAVVVKSDRYGLAAKERFESLHPQRIRQIERDQRTHQEFISNNTGEEYIPQRSLDSQRYNLIQEPLSFSDLNDDEDSVEEVQIRSLNDREVMNIDEDDILIRPPPSAPVQSIEFISQADLQRIDELKASTLTLIAKEEKEFNQKHDIKHSRVPEEFSRPDSPSNSESSQHVVIDLESEELTTQEVNIMETDENESRSDLRANKRALIRQIDDLLEDEPNPRDSTAVFSMIEQFAFKMHQLINTYRYDDFQFIAESFERLQELTGSSYTQLRMNLLAFIYCYPIIKHQVVQWDFGLGPMQKQSDAFKSTIEDIEFNLADLKNSLENNQLDSARTTDLRQVYEGLIRRREEVEEEYGMNAQQAYQELREKILIYCDEFSSWKKFLKTQIDFNTHPIWSKIVNGLIINRIKHFVKEFWMPQADSPSNNICLLIIELFQEVLPLEDMCVHLIVPKLLNVVRKWDPQTDQIPIVQFLEPWFDILGQNLSENIMVAIYKKISPILATEWQVNDPSARVLLKTFQRSCPALLSRILRNNIIPKLEVALLEFEITPNDQDLDIFWQVISWRDLLSLEQLEDLFLEFFFPKWIKVLQVWLENGSVEEKAFEEISIWYSGWKNAFISTGLIDLPNILAQFNSALHLMNIALATRVNNVH